MARALVEFYLTVSTLGPIQFFLGRCISGKIGKALWQFAVVVTNVDLAIVELSNRSQQKLVPDVPDHHVQGKIQGLKR